MSNSGAAQALAIDQVLGSAGVAHEVSSHDSCMAVTTKVVGILWATADAMVTAIAIAIVMAMATALAIVVTLHFNSMVTKHLYMVLRFSPQLKTMRAHRQARETGSSRVLGSDIDDFDVDKHGVYMKRDRKHPTARCCLSVLPLRDQAISQAFWQVSKYSVAYLDIP